MGHSRRKRPSRHQTDRQPGSRSEDVEHLVVGKIVRPHGIRGDVAMKIMTAYPERLGEVETLYVGHNLQPLQVKRVRRHRTGLLVLFESITDRNAAEELRGEMVYVHVDDAVPLEDGEYYLYQLEGIRVVTDDGQELGYLNDYIETGANDVYIITNDGGDELLIPAIPQVIQEVDLEEGLMTVTLLEGLI